MDLHQISASDKALVGQALRAAADGPFFPDWEFQTLFGLTRSEVRAVANAWPNVDLNSSDAALAINNALNNLLGYPHGQHDVWPKWISVSPAELDELFCRLRKAAGESYFDRLRQVIVVEFGGEKSAFDAFHPDGYVIEGRYVPLSKLGHPDVNASFRFPR